MLSQQEVKNIIDQVVGYSKLPGCEVNPWQLPQTQQIFSNPGAKGRWTGIAIEAQVWFTHRARPPLQAGCELPANCKRLQRTVGAACL